MKYENLWKIPSVDTPEESAENVMEIMREQAQYLRDGTDGKVRAEFHEITAEIQNDNGSRELNSSASDKNRMEDANDLYHVRQYGFDIYNGYYKFRLFSMDLTAVYPIYMDLDDDVMKETVGVFRESSLRIGYRDYPEYNNYSEYDSEPPMYLLIKSDDELMKALKILFSSRKVQFILYKLRQQVDAAGVRTSQ